MTALRNVFCRFTYHPAAMRLTLVAFVLAGLLLPMAPIGGGGGV